MLQVKDYKKRGLWVMTKWCENTYYEITRSYSIWNAMRCRCKDGGSIQKLREVYVGCKMSNNFSNYQYFAEWCQGQFGYEGFDEKGKRWQLDKDLLVKGNKLYSEDTCLFLPHKINTALAKGNSSKRKHKIGVCFCNTHKKFVATIRRFNKHVFLGHFTDEMSAFMAYKLAKENYLKELAVLYQDVLDPRAVEALNTYTVEEND